MKNSPFIATRPDAITLADAPINPEWIREGAPKARTFEIARSADGASNTMIWDCTAGTFRWYFGVDETVHILEGGVTVSDDTGHIRMLKAGDIAFFPAGTWMTWRVDTYVKKIAFLRHALPQPFGLALRMLNFALNFRRARKHSYSASPAA
jgi:uncharacterized protein